VHPRPETFGKLEKLVQEALQGERGRDFRGIFVPASFDLRTRFYKVIAGDPALAAFHGGSTHIGWGESWIDADSLIGWLVERAERTSARTAVEDLRRYFDLPANRGRLVVAVTNVTVEKPLRLAKEIVMVPATSIPSVKERFSGRNALYPHSALVRRFRGVPKTWPRDSRKVERGSAVDFEDAGHALTLVGPCAPAVVGYWSELDPALPFSPGAKGTGVYPIHELSIESYNPKLISTADERREAQRVVSLMLSKSESERESFRTPLDRLSLSGRRGRTVDRYLDVGIALESLLAYEDSLTTEIRYRLRVRAARFLGGSLGERQRTAKMVDELYGRRSTVGHGKKIANEPKSAKEAGRRLRETLQELEQRRQELQQDRELVARLIIRALENGIPDWKIFDLEG
jgi:hypothetical protein